MAIGHNVDLHPLEIPDPIFAYAITTESIRVWMDVRASALRDLYQFRAVATISGGHVLGEQHLTTSDYHAIEPRPGWKRFNFNINSFICTVPGHHVITHNIR
ncbi:hypothetical protein SCUCBS95973_004058 [Sporothrix curviconia]|uniref:Uncharacterized protein n=1 Tax=Sporothrix curviconia TaxID=1260050 RepID=A0ABP0BKV1_9PEZI